MSVLVGGSVRKILGREMFDAASRWPVCEVVPENWDPDDPADVEALGFLNRSTKILLHSLSLNILGSTRPDFVLHRLNAWSRALGIQMISDHFCWSATDAHSLGVFVPPIDDIEVLRVKVRTLRHTLGMKVGLENISLSADDPDFCMRYHELFTRVCNDEGMAILLDLENLRLDSVSSGIPATRLLSLYDDAEISGYHVAGSTAGALVLDTHDQPVSEETLQLLLSCYRARQKPVIYERDYALDVTEITAEVSRIAAYLERGLGTSNV
jgi:uncharacterized protein (UPF0276 family)